MNRKHIFFGLVISLTAVFTSLNTSAQGVIVPLPCERRPCLPMPRPVPQLPTALPVKSINITTKIDAQVARTHVEQVFRNDTRFTLEGTYFFPIPETASIVEFAVWEDGKRLAGEVRSREEARRIYDDIVRRNIDPGLLEYAGKDLLQASIFPIPPNSDKKIELTYTEILKAENGTVGYRYPLGTGRNLWRNQPFPDQNVRTPQQFGTVSGRIEISAREAVRNVYSPTHQIETKKRSESSSVVSFETKGNDNDLQLFYGVSNNDLGMSLLTYREPGKDGYFLLMLSPRDEITERELVNKDVVFVLDTSGSMADEGKMDKAKNALLFGIRTLRDGDRFNVINFAGEEHLMERGLISAAAGGKQRGVDFVNKLRPTGGTNINDALIAAVKQFDRSDRPKMLVFMTDGLPTVGERNVERIIENLNKEKPANIRIFPFGFGYDVNTALLDRIGSENGGISDYVQPKEDLEIKVSNFFSRVSSPVLSDLDLDLGPVIAEYMYPRKLTDLFRGMQLTVIGRYKNTNDLRNITFKLTGKAAGERKEFRYTNLDMPIRSDGNEFLPRLWAGRRVGWLLEQIRLNGETKELKDEVIELGTRFGLVTPYTSYLAADGSMVNVRREAAASGAFSSPMKAKIAERSGADAVRLSVQQNAMQSNATLADSAEDSGNRVIIRNSSTNQFIGNKNFINQDGIWIDSDAEKQRNTQEVRIKFGSREYFELIGMHRELGQYLSLGEQVVVEWRGIIYRIVK